MAVNCEHCNSPEEYQYTMKSVTLRHWLACISHPAEDRMQTGYILRWYIFTLVP